MPTPAARDSLLFMEARPEIVGADLAIVDIEVAERHGFLTARLPAGKALEGTPMLMIGALHELALRDHLASHRDWPIIHGASVVVHGKRLLLIGDKGLGKSTLSVHLLTRGHLVEGDEHVAVGVSSVVARPRTLRVKSGTFAVVDGLPCGLDRSPSVTTWDGIPVYAVSPSLFGRPWRIAEGPLHSCVVLQPNWGGRSVASRISPETVFAALMANAHFGTGGSVLALAARLRALAVGTPAYVLRLGDITNAQWHLENIARS